MTIASWEVLVTLQQKQETSLLYSFKYIGLETAYSSKDPPAQNVDLRYYRSKEIITDILLDYFVLISVIVINSNSNWT